MRQTGGSHPRYSGPPAPGQAMEQSPGAADLPRRDRVVRRTQPMVGHRASARRQRMVRSPRLPCLGTVPMGEQGDHPLDETPNRWITSCRLSPMGLGTGIPLEAISPPSLRRYPPRYEGSCTDEPRHLDLRWAKTATDLDLTEQSIPERSGRSCRTHARSRQGRAGGRRHPPAPADTAVGTQRSRGSCASGCHRHVVSVFAISQRNSARAATATAHQELLVADSQTQIGSNPQLATLLAVEADRRTPTPASRNALAQRCPCRALLAAKIRRGDRGCRRPRRQPHRLDRPILAICLSRRQSSKPKRRAGVELANRSTSGVAGCPIRRRDQEGPLDVASTADGSDLWPSS